MKIDLILRNGHVWTMGEPGRTHALGILSGRIVAVGDDTAGLEADRVVDLGGRTVVPGFHDAHAHTGRFGLGLTQLDLSDATGLDDIYRRVVRRAADLPDGAWLIGHGYEPAGYGGGHPRRADLDRIAPAHRVWLKHRSEHMGVGNTLVLDDAGVFGIDQVRGGIIERDGAGEPTGLLQEQAQALVNDLLVPVAVRELVEAIGAAHRRYVAEGLVACQEAGIGGGWIGLSPVELAAYQTALREGKLRVRTTLMPAYETLRELNGHDTDEVGLGLDLGLTTGLGDPMLRLGAVKIFADGALASRTAAMTDEFSNEPGNRGVLQLEPEELRDRIIGAHRSGWQVATHAIGDRAVGLVIDAYREALTRWPRSDARHRIEHCSVTTPDHISALAELGVVPVLQNYFIHTLGDAVLANVGPQRSDWVYRLRSLLDAGIPAAGSSDRPVADGAPLKAIQRMLTRRTADGQAFSPHEAVSFEDALRCYTVNAAHSAFLENQLGTLTPGKLADAVVLAEDPTAVPTDSLDQIGIAATIIGGQPAHDPHALLG
ncbi:amidohydrolase family protein [Saccharopolyspora shandongensis]|uniref:amidohydrolase n=1 Tax=Saccharopolyspora shandongensis TaxID=418495 RepID=UPI00342910D9